MSIQKQLDSFKNNLTSLIYIPEKDQNIEYALKILDEESRIVQVESKDSDTIQSFAAEILDDMNTRLKI